MSINLTEQMKDFAWYLPSIQVNSSLNLANDTSLQRKCGFPAGLRPTDLDFTSSTNRFWSYQRCLASAGHFMYSKASNTITNRENTTFVLTDSSGFQLGHGSLKDIKPWLKYAEDPAKIISLWRTNSFKQDLFKWQELNGTLGHSLDIPLWSRGLKKSPFKNLSPDELTELSLENLRFIHENQGRYNSNFGYLSVLQGETIDEEQIWFNQVRQYPLSGWSLAGKVGQMGGICRILRRILMLRDDKFLEPPYNTLHILRLSRVRWAPIMTAIQNAVRSTTGNNSFQITMDSSSPYKIGGMMTQYAAMNEFGDDIKTWTINHHPVPTGWHYSNLKQPMPLNNSNAGHIPAAFDSPIASLLTAQDLNIKSGDFEQRTIDAFSDEVIINHNCYVYINAIIKSNEAVFSNKAPQTMLDACGAIKDIFEVANWRSALKKYNNLLTAAVGGSANDFPDDP